MTNGTVESCMAIYLGMTITTGISYFAVCHGRRQRQGWRTAKGSGKVGYGKELLCRLLSEADGKGAFAISG